MTHALSHVDLRSLEIARSCPSNMNDIMLRSLNKSPAFAYLLLALAVASSKYGIEVMAKPLFELWEPSLERQTERNWSLHPPANDIQASKDLWHPGQPQRLLCLLALFR